MKTLTSKLRFLLALAGTLAAISILTSAPAAADDRDILRESTTKPYLFVILDTSGSMNWAPKCTAVDFAARKCDYLCPTGDCATPREGDDPASKFRQAKEALYEVLRTVDDIDVGFATFNADDERVIDKHWLYRVRSGEPQITLASGAKFPAYDTDEVFGPAVGCDRGGSVDQEMGCFANGGRSSDTTDLWEMTKVRRLPKFGVNPNTTVTPVTFYIRNSNQVYFVTYSGSTQPYDGQLVVHVRVDRCTGTPLDNPGDSCNAAGERTLQGQQDIKYDLVGDFVWWDFNVRRTPVVGGQSDGWFGQQFSSSGGACNGWDPNDDPTADEFVNGANQSNLKQRTGQDGNPGPYYDPTGTTHDWRFTYGDVIPLSWSVENKSYLLNRLAPRLNGGDPTTDPEAFANATYLKDNQVAGEAYLRVKDLVRKPLIPISSTPLGASLVSFRNWYKGCTSDTSACNGSTGWDDFAAANDSNWGCRRKFVLVLTDGDETCGGNPCAMTDILDDTDGNGDGVSTYVVGFGVQAGANVLTCMAANGGTGAPILPQNKQELIDALEGILSLVREEASAFASAAVPQVQANATDKVFLSSFTPIGDEGFWAGRMDSFLKPLPLDDQGRPDRSVLCDSSTKASCFLWDAGDVQEGFRGGAGIYDPQGFLLQAPHPDDVDAIPPFDPAELQLGTGADERRVVYTQYNEPGNRKLFTYPSTNSQKYDLWTGMGIGYIVGNTASETAADDQANSIITRVLLEKEGTIEVPDPGNPGNTITTPVTYLLGDIFHADPLVINKPADFNFYTSDPYRNQALCGVAADPTRTPPPSYKWFADRNVCRRTILFTAANDGQLHAFDAGIFRDPVGGGSAECLLPAKDLDGDGVSETDEYGDGTIDYDTGDNVESDTEHVIDGAYDNGSGREVFSFIPRAMLKPVRKLVEDHDRNKGPWGVDGSPRLADVFIDPLASEAGSTTCLDREWRSVLLGGYREGGPGYYALDITQPDTLDNQHVPEPTSGYTPSCFDGNSDCANRPYPSVLWEFQDTHLVRVAGVDVNLNLDEDLNNERDLGNSWSKVTTGRIRVCTGACTAAETEDRFVAIFGGGLGDDPTFPRGNYVYMVDIETGKVLYKKRVIGSITADISAVDANGDSYIDRLYFGTTAGFIYKVQLETSAATPMKLLSQTFQTRNAGVNYNFTDTRLIGPPGPNLNKYDPFQVFSTSGRPIYQQITAIYVAKSNRVALAVGTGNRWNLWQSDGQTGRFYMLLDTDFVDSDHDGVLNISCSGCTQPLTESKYEAIAPDDPNDAAGPELLYDGNGSGSLPGWYLTLEPEEKVITEAFSLSGISIFTSFQPTEVPNDDGTCSRAGRSHIFIVGTVTALGYSIPTGGDLTDRQRYTEVQQFTTPPFVEQSATKNPEAGGDDNHADYITESLALIRDELKSLQSTRCRYANYTQNIKTIRSDTGLVFIAPVPLCIDPTSWKEF
ncbi:MAG: hypothetical protein ABI689_13490 [Thermoanaerobaculia bacterium]